MEEEKKRTQLEVKLTYPNSSEFDFFTEIETIDFDVECANDIANGLSWNAPTAVVVSSSIEIETQPYFYEMGRFKWVNNVTEDF